MADPLQTALKGSVNSEIVDALVGHQIGLMRYDSSIVKQIMDLLGDSREHLASTLYTRLRMIEKKGFDRGPVTTARALAQLQEVNKLSASVGDDVGKLLETELRRLGNYEARFQQELLKGLVPINISYIRPSPEQLNALVTKLPYVGKFYGEHISAFAARQFEAVADRVRVGMIAGENLDTIVRSVVGTAGFKYSDGVWTGRQKKAQVETLVRTSVNQVSSATRDEVYKANSDIIKGVQIVATLDGRTTLICQLEDGKVYPIGEGPRPPFHYNCRTVTAPVLKGLDEITGRAKDKISMDPSERAMLDGVASAKVNYEGWLRSQNVQMQRFVLGPKRQLLYQKNPTMQLSRFADKFGRSLSLEELAFTDAKLFFNLTDDEIRSYVQWIGERRVTELITGKKKPSPVYLERQIAKLEEKITAQGIGRIEYGEPVMKHVGKGVYEPREPIKVPTLEQRRDALQALSEALDDVDAAGVRGAGGKPLRHDFVRIVNDPGADFIGEHGGGLGGTDSRLLINMALRDLREKKYADAVRDLGDNFKPVYLNRDLRESIIHEMGHLHQTLYTREVFPETGIDKEWFDAFTRFTAAFDDDVPLYHRRFVSFYSEETEGEWYAESFLAYVREGRKLDAEVREMLEQRMARLAFGEVPPRDANVLGIRDADFAPWIQRHLIDGRADLRQVKSNRPTLAQALREADDEGFRVNNIRGFRGGTDPGAPLAKLDRNNNLLLNTDVLRSDTRFHRYHQDGGRGYLAQLRETLRQAERREIEAPPGFKISRTTATRKLLDEVEDGRKLAPDEIIDSLTPEDRARVEAYIKRAEANEAEYKGLIQSVADELGYTPGDFADPQPETFFFGPLKKANRVAEKTIMDYNGDLERVSDVLRMTYVVDDPEDAMKIYQRLAQSDSPVDLKQRMIEPGMGGYRDLAFKLTLKDGMKAEIQINTRPMLLAKSGPGHKFYEAMRVLKPDNPEFQQLLRRSEALYLRAWRETCEKYPSFGGCVGIRKLPGEFDVPKFATVQDAERWATTYLIDDENVKFQQEIALRIDQLSDDEKIKRYGSLEAAEKAKKIVHFEGLELEDVQTICEEVYAAQRRYNLPRLKGIIDTMKQDHVGIFGYEFEENILAWNKANFLLGKERGETLAALVKRNHASGFISEWTPREIIQHEVLHYIRHTHPDADVQDLMQAVMSEAKFSGAAGRISRYAKTNDEELWAELFAAAYRRGTLELGGSGRPQREFVLAVEKAYEALGLPKPPRAAPDKPDIPRLFVRGQPPREPLPKRVLARKVFDAEGDSPIDERYVKYLETPAEGELKEEIEQEAARLLERESSARLHKDENGNWTPERAALHEDIIEHYLSRLVDEPGQVDLLQPTAHYVGGGPATGKSTAIRLGRVQLPRDHVSVDADGIKTWLPEYQRMLKGRIDEAAAFAHEESSYIQWEIVRRLQRARGYHYVQDGVNDGTVEQWVQMVKEARAAGYRVVGDYNTVPDHLAVKRAVLRGDQTGRKVPNEVVQSANYDIASRLPQMLERDLFDELRLWDTEISGKPTLVLEAKDGRIIVHDRYTWNRFVAQGGKEALDAADRLADRIEYATPNIDGLKLIRTVEKASKGKEQYQRALVMRHIDESGGRLIDEYDEMRVAIKEIIGDDLDPDAYLGEILRTVDDAELESATIVLRAGTPDAPQPTVTLAFKLKDSEGRLLMNTTRIFERDGDNIIAIHSSMHLGEHYQGNGLGKDILRRTMQFYQQAGVSKVEVGTAVDVGAYAWPRYGFKNSVNSWSELRGRIKGKLTPGKTWEPPRTGRMEHTKLGMWRDGVDAQKALAKLDPVDRARLMAILDDPDPRAIWHLADLDARVEVDGEMVRLGKALLTQESHTSSVLDLNDTEAMARFWKYVGAEARGDEAEKLFRESAEELAEKIVSENRAARYASRKYNRDAPGDGPGDEAFVKWMETPAEGDELETLQKEIEELLPLDESIKVHQDAQGRWLPERQQLHDDVVDYVVSKLIDEPTNVDVEELTFHMMGGGPASGKTTAINQGFVHLPRGHSLINADLIKDWIPEYQKMLRARQIEGASFAHEESSYLAKRILARLFKERKQNIVLDGTGDGNFERSLKAKILQARAAGYRVVGDYNTLPDDLAWDIAQKRAIKKGRHVPEEIVRGTHSKVSVRMLEALDEDLFDELRLWDNQIHKQARLVATTKRGEKITIHDRAGWDRFIKKGGPKARVIADKLERDGRLEWKRHSFDDLFTGDKPEITILRPDADIGHPTRLDDETLKASLARLRGDGGTEDLDIQTMLEDMVAGTPYKIDRIRVEIRDFESSTDLHWFARITDQDGATVGMMRRQLRREHKTGRVWAYNDNFEVNDNHHGLGKLFIRSQIDNYDKLGVENVELTAAQVGPYAWARYGWVPKDVKEWNAVKGTIRKRLKKDESKDWAKGLELFTKEQRTQIRELLKSDDPRTIWKIADFNEPVVLEGRTHTVGKLLLKNNGYEANLDLTDPVSMSRFWKYVGDPDRADRAAEELAEKAEVAAEKALASRARTRKVFQDAPGDSPLDEEYVGYLEKAATGSQKKQLQKDADEILAKGNDTEAIFKTADGKYTPEREALHADILDSIMASLRASETDVELEDLTFHFMGGGPASAKTTAVREGFVHLPKDHVMINADLIKDWLPEYQKLLKLRNPDAASFVHEESSYLSELLRKRILAERRHHGVLDGTGDGKFEKLTRKIKEAKDAGYRVVADYNTLPEDLAWKIAKARADKTGRYVPEEIVRGTHRKVSVRFMQVVDDDLFDELRLWDNEIKGVPRLVLEKREGRYVVVDRDLWRKFVDKGGDDARRFADRLEVESKLIFEKKRAKSLKDLLQPSSAESEVPTKEALIWCKQNMNVEGQPDFDIERTISEWLADTDYNYESVSLHPQTIARGELFRLGVDAEVFDQYDNKIAEISRTFLREKRSGELLVQHKILFVNEKGRGFGKKIMRRALEDYERLNVKRVQIGSTIELGGYAWPRYGFTPDKDSWDRVRYELTKIFFDTDDQPAPKHWLKSFANPDGYDGDTEALAAARKAFQALPPGTRAQVAAILEDANPRAAWRLADLRDAVTILEGKQVPLGRALLYGRDLRLELELDDHVAMARAWRYMGDIKRAEMHADKAAGAIEEVSYALSKGTVDNYMTASDTWKYIRTMLPAADADDPAVREAAEKLFQQVAREQILEGKDEKIALKAAKTATEEYLEAEAEKAIEAYATRTFEDVWDRVLDNSTAGVRRHMAPDPDGALSTSTKVVEGRDFLITPEIEQLVKEEMRRYVDKQIKAGTVLDENDIAIRSNLLFDKTRKRVEEVATEGAKEVHLGLIERLMADLVTEGLDTRDIKDSKHFLDITQMFNLGGDEGPQFREAIRTALIRDLQKQLKDEIDLPPGERLMALSQQGVVFRDVTVKFSDETVTKLKKELRKRIETVWQQRLTAHADDIAKVIVTPQQFHNFPLGQQQYFSVIRTLEASGDFLPEKHRSELREQLEARWKAYMDEVKQWDREQLIYNAKLFNLPDEALQDADNSDLLELFYAVNEKAHYRAKREIVEKHRGKTGMTGAKQREMLLDENDKNAKELKKINARLNEIDDADQAAQQRALMLADEFDRLSRDPAASPELLKKTQDKAEQGYQEWSALNAKLLEERAALKEKREKLQKAAVENFYRRIEVPKSERQKLPGKMKSKFAKKEELKFDLKEKKLVKKIIEDDRKLAIKEARDFVPRIWHRHLASEGANFHHAKKPKNPLKRWASYFSEETKDIYLRPGCTSYTGIHEVGHWIENTDPEVHRAIIAWLKRRTAGETAQHLGAGHDADEFAYFDKFMLHYIGKVYAKSGDFDDATATEVLSVGLQLLRTNPVEFATQDPDMFDFIVNLCLDNLFVSPTEAAKVTVAAAGQGYDTLMSAGAALTKLNLVARTVGEVRKVERIVLGQPWPIWQYAFLSSTERGYLALGRYLSATSVGVVYWDELSRTWKVNPERAAELGWEVQ